MSFLVAFLNILIIGGLAWWLGAKATPQQRPTFWAALCFKLLAGLALGAVYFYYYRLGDTLGFFHDAVRLVEILLTSPQAFFASLVSGTPPIELVNHEPRSFFFTVLLCVVNLATGNSYWISSLWFSMFAFACVWYLVVRISVHLPGIYKASVVAFLFFPSVVFWSAGIIKESVGFGSLCFLTGIFVSLLDRRRLAIYEYVGAVIAVWLLLNLKYYWAAVFFPSVLTSLVIRWLLSNRIIRTWELVISWVVIFTSCSVAASFTHPNFYLDNFLEVIRLNYEEFASISNPNNLIHFPRVVNTWTDLMINAPWALFSGLFRPLLFEPDSITGHVSSIENFVLLVLALASLTRIGKTTGSNKLFWFSIIAYVCLLCIFLASSTPNFGTLSRYRIGFLPFFVLLIVHGNPLIKRLGLKDF